MQEIILNKKIYSLVLSSLISVSLAMEEKKTGLEGIIQINREILKNVSEIAEAEQEYILKKRIMESADQNTQNALITEEAETSKAMYLSLVESNEKKIIELAQEKINIYSSDTNLLIKDLILPNILGLRAKDNPPYDLRKSKLKAELAKLSPSLIFASTDSKNNTDDQKATKAIEKSLVDNDPVDIEKCNKKILELKNNSKELIEKSNNLLEGVQYQLNILIATSISMGTEYTEIINSREVLQRKKDYNELCKKTAKNIEENNEHLTSCLYEIYSMHFELYLEHMIFPTFFKDITKEAATTIYEANKSLLEDIFREKYKLFCQILKNKKKLTQLKTEEIAIKDRMQKTEYDNSQLLPTSESLNGEIRNIIYNNISKELK